MKAAIHKISRHLRIHLYKMSRTGKFIKTKSELDMAWDWKDGMNKEGLLNGYGCFGWGWGSW